VHETGKTFLIKKNKNKNFKQSGQQVPCINDRGKNWEDW
jgi:hypothetical protein